MFYFAYYYQTHITKRLYNSNKLLKDDLFFKTTRRFIKVI